MAHVVRWTRSAYETDDDLEHEAQGARALGLEWTLWPAREPPPFLESTDVLVAPSGAKVTAREAARLRGNLVLTTTSGVDHVDVEACRSAGVRVARSPTARRDAVVAHSLASMIGLQRRLVELDAASASGRWARAQLPELAPRSLAGARVGVVGLGVIGRAMVRALQPLGADVVEIDPFVDDRPTVAFGEALDTLDVLTLHCSLTPSSRGLVDAAALERLPAHAVVVQTARGAVLDVHAAVERVREGRLGGLACDVFPSEPPDDLGALGGHPRLLLTPHSAGYTTDLGRRVTAEVVATLARWVEGAPLPHPVRPSGA